MTTALETIEPAAQINMLFPQLFDVAAVGERRDERIGTMYYIFVPGDERSHYELLELAREHFFGERSPYRMTFKRHQMAIVKCDNFPHRLKVGISAHRRLHGSGAASPEAIREWILEHFGLDLTVEASKTGAIVQLPWGDAYCIDS
jgi:hypothetical protein